VSESAKPFKVGFIGAGGIARTHMKYLKDIPGVEIVAAADVSDENLEKCKKEYNVQRSYKDFHELLKVEKEMDAVSICTPNGLHAPNTIAALEAGKHVMVEKPMAMNAKEGKQMVEAAKKAGKHLIVGFQYRFSPQSQLVREYCQTGQLGKIMYVRCQALRRRGIPNWGVFGRKDLQGGGPMIDIGVHILEAAHYCIGSPNPITCTGNTWTFMGNKPSSVRSNWPNWDHKTYTVEDMATGMIRFETGTMLTIEASFVAHIEKDIFNFQVMGENGGVNWETSQIFHDVGGYMLNSTPGYVGQWDHFKKKMEHFVAVCRDGAPNESDGNAGLMVQQMLDGVYASAEAKREVIIDTGTPARKEPKL
jgi:predicted dehydrogenase